MTFDDVFTTSGFFGVEIAPDVAAQAGTRIALRGYLHGPLVSGESDYVLGRGSMRYCPCCSGEPRYGDDLALVRLREPLAEIDGDAEVEIVGTLEVGYAESEHPGLATTVRLLDAVV